MGKTVGPGPWCGTAGGYSNHDCRCEACRKAWADAHRQYMKRHPEQQEKHRQAQRRRYRDRKGDA